MKISRADYASLYGPTIGDRFVHGFQGKVEGAL
jgi:urease alpha subunit